MACKRKKCCLYRVGRTDRRLKERKFSLLLAFLSAAVFLLAAFTPVRAGSIYLETGGGYETGDFGSPVDSRLFYAYSRAGYLTPDFEVNIAAPFYFLKEEGEGESRSETGLGDVIVQAGGNLLGETDDGFSLHGLLSLKLPTADEDKGLGTGQTDYGAFLTINKKIERFRFWLTGGAIIIGDSDEQDYDNQLYYGIGIARTFERSEIYVSLEGYREVVWRTANPLGLNFGFFHVLSPKYAVRGNLLAGMTHGESDYGGAFSVVRFFH